MEKKLYRNPNDRVLGGVAAGLSRYFDIDVTWVRILFILAAIFGLSGFLVYVILWIAVPEQPFTWNSTTDYRVNKDEATAAPEPLIPAPAAPSKKENSRNIGGFILIFMGLFFLLRELDLIPFWFRLGKLWPLALIIPGLVMLANSSKKNAAKTEPTAEPESKKADDDQNTSIH